MQTTPKDQQTTPKGIETTPKDQQTQTLDKKRQEERQQHCVNPAVHAAPASVNLLEIPTILVSKASTVSNRPSITSNDDVTDMTPSDLLRPPRPAEETNLFCGSQEVPGGNLSPGSQGHTGCQGCEPNSDTQDHNDNSKLDPKYENTQCADIADTPHDYQTTKSAHGASGLSTPEGNELPSPGCLCQNMESGDSLPQKVLSPPSHEYVNSPASGSLWVEVPNAQKAIGQTSGAVGPRTAVRGPTAADVGPMAFPHVVFPGEHAPNMHGLENKRSSTENAKNTDAPSSGDSDTSREVGVHAPFSGPKAKPTFSYDVSNTADFHYRKSSAGDPPEKKRGDPHSPSNSKSRAVNHDLQPAFDHSGSRKVNNKTNTETQAIVGAPADLEDITMDEKDTADPVYTDIATTDEDGSQTAEQILAELDHLYESINYTGAGSRSSNASIQSLIDFGSTERVYESTTVPKEEDTTGYKGRSTLSSLSSRQSSRSGSSGGKQSKLLTSLRALRNFSPGRKGNTYPFVNPLLPAATGTGDSTHKGLSGKREDQYKTLSHTHHVRTLSEPVCVPCAGAARTTPDSSTLGKQSPTHTFNSTFLNQRRSESISAIFAEPVTPSDNANSGWRMLLSCFNTQHDQCETSTLDSLVKQKEMSLYNQNQNSLQFWTKGGTPTRPASPRSCAIFVTGVLLAFLIVAVIVGIALYGKKDDAHTYSSGDYVHNTTRFHSLSVVIPPAQLKENLNIICSVAVQDKTANVDSCPVSRLVLLFQRSADKRVVIAEHPLKLDMPSRDLHVSGFNLTGNCSAPWMQTCGLRIRDLKPRIRRRHVSNELIPPTRSALPLWSACCQVRYDSAECLHQGNYMCEALVSLDHNESATLHSAPSNLVIGGCTEVDMKIARNKLRFEKMLMPRIHGTKPGIRLTCALPDELVDTFESIAKIVITKIMPNRTDVTTVASMVNYYMPKDTHQEDPKLSCYGSLLATDGQPHLAVEWDRWDQADEGNYTCTMEGRLEKAVARHLYSDYIYVPIPE